MENEMKDEKTKAGNLAEIFPILDDTTVMYPFSGGFDFMGENSLEKNSLSFMDLLGFNDYRALDSTILDGPPPKPMFLPQPVLPETPNSSSVSSESMNYNQNLRRKLEEEKEEEEEMKTTSKNLLKIEKKGQKRPKPREQRFAFVTRSDTDNLEDGYRWRKYGQKAVKNSPFPRSYYRCTNTSCGVKKRVERSSEDRTVVVTTYEGRHTHPCPTIPRHGSSGFLSGTGGFIGGVANFGSSIQLGQIQMQYQAEEELSLSPYMKSLQSPSFGYSTSLYYSFGKDKQRQQDLFTNEVSGNRDQGLLEDIIASDIKKQE